MRIGMYTDVHYCENSSIIRTKGEKYSSRLENCIKSVNWAEEMFTQLNVDKVVCLGDFFDKPTLTAEEITSLNELKFSNKPHTFIVGNHEIVTRDNSISSMHYFKNKPNFEIVSQPLLEEDVENKLYTLYLPYLTKSDRWNSIKDYLDLSADYPVLILSHNDLAGIRYGSFVSEEGFDVKDIEDNCNLFVNGHLHNGQFINEKQTILNLGNLTGQNFSEDAFNHRHLICVLDTETWKLDFYENPYAYNFYKLDLINEKYNLEELGPNAVVSATLNESIVEETKEHLNKLGIINRLIIKANNRVLEESSKEDLNVDHLKLFKNFVLENIENTKTLTEEINTIIGGS